MIIRRFAAALRRQDWFTVLIEIAIVFIGIFLGLQADDWAEERQNRQREQAALERLFFEAQNAHELLLAVSARTLRLNRLRRNAVQFADSDADKPDEDLPLRIGINTLAQFPNLNIVSVAYDELRSSGQMQLIRDTALREQIANFYTDIDGFEDLQRGFGDSGDSYFSFYRRHVTWDYNPESTTTDILLSNYDWESLRADEDFIFVAIGQLRNQLVSEEGILHLRDQAAALCTTLGSRLGQACGSESGDSDPL